MGKWNLIVTRGDGKVYNLVYEEAVAKEMTVQTFKKAIQERTGENADALQLHQGGKMLESGRRLGSYPHVANGSNFFVVYRLKGGATQGAFCETPRKLTTGVPKSVDSCIISATCDDDTPAARMPCSHSYCASCLMFYAWSEVSNNKTELCCCLCKTEWTFPTVKRFGNASDKEMELLDEGLTKNALKQDPTIWQCPGCNNYCTRSDISENSVNCFVCAKKKGKSEDYCFRCLRPWKGNNRIDCGYKDCFSEHFKDILSSAPMKSSSYLPGVKFPSKRSCVSCGLILEHTDGCKHVVCTVCKIEFCFVCLRHKTDGSSPCGNHITVCALAPVQQEIPRKM